MNKNPGGALLVACLILLSVQATAEERDRNLVLITIDTLRADYLSSQRLPEGRDTLSRPIGEGRCQLYPYSGAGSHDPTVPRIDFDWQLSSHPWYSG